MVVVAHKILETNQSPNSSFPFGLNLGLGLELVNKKREYLPQIELSEHFKSIFGISPGGVPNNLQVCKYVYFNKLAK